MHKSAAHRLEALRKVLRRESTEGLLVTHPVNVTYLSGFGGDSTYLLVLRNRAVLISDTRYETQLQEECPGFDLEIRDSQTTTLALTVKVIQSLGCRELAIEADSLTKASFDSLAQALPAVELISSSQWVEELRAVKDRDELAAIRRSIRINQRAFEVIRARLQGAQTEREIAYQLEHQMRCFGATQAAFKPIVGVGPRSALPHGLTTDRRIDSSPFVLIDWGAMVDGYASDLTRVLVTGKAPQRFRKIYQTVLEAQLRAIEAIRPGQHFKTVDAAARGHIERAGFGKHFGHGLGHGFGLQIHELPFVSPTREGQFKPGMVVTVEPGIYLPDFGGVRIEDMVLVTPDGCEVLSDLPKQLDAMQVELL